MVLKYIVKGWNYVTGGTQRSLADLTLVAGTAMECSAGINSEEVFGYLCVPLSFLLTSATLVKRNMYQGYHKSSKDKGMLVPDDITNEDLKNGTFFSSIGIFIYFESEIRGFGFFNKFISYGLMVRGLSHFINRTESPPPGKNILERAIEGYHDRFGSKVTATVEVSRCEVLEEYLER